MLVISFLLSFQVPNDYARLISPVLESGTYSIQFFYHAEGNGVSALSIHTRGESSPFAKRVWYHTAKFNGTITEWTQVRVEVSQVTAFHVRQPNYVTIILI